MVMCEANGTTYTITRPQDFQDIVPSGVYEAMREYFGFESLGDDSYPEQIRYLEHEKDNLAFELEHQEDENRDLENENDDLRDENEKLKEQRDSLIKQIEAVQNTVEPLRRILAAVQEAAEMAGDM